MPLYRVTFMLNSGKNPAYYVRASLPQDAHREAYIKCERKHGPAAEGEDVLMVVWDHTKDDWAPVRWPHYGYPHERSCECCAKAKRCNFCGNETNGHSICTNGRCYECCNVHCKHEAR